MHLGLGAYHDGGASSGPTMIAAHPDAAWATGPAATDVDLLSNGADPRGQRRSLAVIECPKAMVGRVIGKNGETIR
jgi:hypothetical protein